MHLAYNKSKNSASVICVCMSVRLHKCIGEPQKKTTKLFIVLIWGEKSGNGRRMKQAFYILLNILLCDLNCILFFKKANVLVCVEFLS